MKPGFSLIMDEQTLRKSLSDIPLGSLRYFSQTGSTNDIALAWAASGAPDLAMVYAEEQTSGRGRGKHSWFTPPGSALAFSLVMKPLPGEEQAIPRFTALGALGVCEALGALDLNPQIKWPNDILINNRKVCGVLAESVWLGDKLESIVVGIGINVRMESVPPPGQVSFPASSLEQEAHLLDPKTLNRVTDRPALLRQILEAILYWRGLVSRDIFLHAWETRLAFLGEQVVTEGAGQDSLAGKVEGLNPDGSLRLSSDQGKTISVQFGEVHLRPVV
jgi:BirA family transcriptional regulator, biotin operon repressor / biotin---[acetyl-CoA-carboxylase] ligase